MYPHELLAQFEYPSKKRKNNNQTHRGRPPGVNFLGIIYIYIRERFAEQLSHNLDPSSEQPGKAAINNPSNPAKSAIFANIALELKMIMKMNSLTPN